MSCPMCTDPDGQPCMPQYGLAPHTHDLADGWIGSTRLLPREQWPSNFRLEPGCDRLGIWWCGHCGEGKPEEVS